MSKWIRENLNKDEGFTLVELMVVVLIIAILIAIAIPTFLGARERAQDRAAQSDLRNALTAAKVFYTDTEDYLAAAADLEAIEPSLTWSSPMPIPTRLGSWLRMSSPWMMTTTSSQLPSRVLQELGSVSRTLPLVLDPVPTTPAEPPWLTLTPPPIAPLPVGNQLS
jgi:prepilin-type N-terminal cleavage/methylation domain-containing protein